MARPKQVSDADLFTVAREVFMKHGPSAPVSAVAKRLGVTSAALFHRIGSKDELLRIALHPANPPEVEVLREGLKPGRSARQQLIEILSGLSEYYAIAVPAFFLMHAGGFPIGRREGKSFRPLVIVLREYLARWLDQAKSDPSVKTTNSEVAADVLLGALEARFMHNYLRSKKSSPELNREFVRNLVRELMD